MSNDPTAKYAALLGANPPPKKARAHMSRRDPATGLKDVRKVSIFFAEEDCAYREAVRPYLQNNAKGWQGALERLILDHTRLKSIPQYGTVAEFNALSEAAQTAQLQVADQQRKIEKQAALVEEQKAKIEVLEGILDRALAAKIGGQS